MAKIISYTLTEKGKVPHYVIDGGYFSFSVDAESPRDWLYLGIANDDAPEAEITDFADYFETNNAPTWTDSENQIVTYERIANFLEGLK